MPRSAKRLNTPENVRTTTLDRWTLGSRALAHALNLADALSRLTFSPLTILGMFRRFAPGDIRSSLMTRWPTAVWRRVSRGARRTPRQGAGVTTKAQAPRFLVGCGDGGRSRDTRRRTAIPLRCIFPAY